ISLQNILLLVVVTLHGSDGARILGLFPIPGRSHMNVNAAIIEELARRGHQVTVVSPFPLAKPIPNYTEMVMKKMDIEDMGNATGSAERFDPFDMKDMNYIAKVAMLWGFGQAFCDMFLQDPAVQKLMQSDDLQFDLIMTENFYLDCFLGFAHKYKVPVVQVCSFGGSEVIGDLVGNPYPYAYVPDVFQELTDKMDFKGRLQNTLGLLFQQLGKIIYYIPKQNALMRKHFNSPDMPSIMELEKYTALVLVNHHFSISYPRPLMPNLVQVGGMHIKPPKELPQDLKKFLDEAPDGVIFFSMGSNLKSSKMKEGTIKALVEAFSKLKQKVLWKWETDSLPGQPKNLKLGKWLPQSDILAHPNVRLFITHGGLLSTQETIARGVPIVGIPIFGDQRLNMNTALARGYGQILEYENITTESVLWAINEVLENPRYRENAQRLSRIYRDQPLSPLDQAVFWTEYVIRHKGAPHMRSAALDLAWYQYFLLDVIAVLALGTGTVLFVVFVIVRALLRKLCGGTKSKVTKVSDKKKRK
ncbi:hypothetical protein ANN_10945, partial [Periplaneta americana]